MDFAEMQKKVEAALALLDSETADAIIGEATDEYRTLIQGMDGAHGMMFVMAASSGMKNNAKTRQMAGQSKLAMLTLLHYAFALGVQHGRGDAPDRSGE
jgi:hypothetical protein